MHSLLIEARLPVVDSCPADMRLATGLGDAASGFPDFEQQFVLLGCGEMKVSSFLPHQPMLTDIRVLFKVQLTNTNSI